MHTEYTTEDFELVKAVLKRTEEGIVKYSRLVNNYKEKQLKFKNILQDICPHENLDVFADEDPHKGCHHITYCKDCGKEL